MAENKKSVLLYCDLINTVEKLKDVDAGKLFKHYLRYVNDQNPKPPTQLIEIVFEPIKQQLKRDLKKWENKSIKNSEAAKARWDKKNANGCETMQTHANVSNAMRNDAKHADIDIDTVTVTDTVKVKDTVTVKEKKEIHIPPLDEFLSYAEKNLGMEFPNYKKGIELKYTAWTENGWKDGHNKKIINWKSKLLNTIPFIKPEKHYGEKEKKSDPIVKGLTAYERVQNEYRNAANNQQ